MDPETNEKYIPYCVEPSLGADRVTLAFLVDAYDEEVLTDAKGKEDIRTVLHFHPAIAPYKAAVLPLTKKQSEQAEAIYEELSKYFMVDYDVTGSIGKRYRREDEIGTPFCITVDFDTEVDNSVTIRDRDTMEQIRIPVSEVRKYIEDKLLF
jgi:glycyl-tRNA synthetase